MKIILQVFSTLYSLALLVTWAEATINLKVAEVQNGVAVIQGSKAVPTADIFWEGQKVTQANQGGNFSFSGVVPSDCIGTLSDGTPIQVDLLNCTPVSTALAPLSGTGQTLCYAADGSATIPCAGTGQDGELRRGITWPTPRFVDNGNGTISDNLTGLIWLREANCFGSLTWSQALAAANSVATSACNLSDDSVAGDWRLQT